MKRQVVGALIVGLVLTAEPAWALSDGDVGNAWNAAPTRQQIQVANILSRELGVDPEKLQQCINQTFADPANAGKTILEAARQCKQKAP